jgi:hypothetical protein
MFWIIIINLMKNIKELKHDFFKRQKNIILQQLRDNRILKIDKKY